MKLNAMAIPDVLVVNPTVFGDKRGFFYESYNEKKWYELTGLNTRFVQNNHSKSIKGVLRGIHYQIEHPQGKLVRVIAGEVFDVAVDLRQSSPTFGKWVSEHLSADNKKMMWIPEGFGHGFLVLSESAELLYSTTDFYAQKYERCIVWNDPTLNIEWPLDGKPLLSEKDARGCLFNKAEYYK